jgi:hypothetical protein
MLVSDWNDPPIRDRAAVAMRMPMTASSEYALELLREDANFTLYRGRQHGNPSPVLAVALAAEQPSPQGLRRLEHEYSLAAELDPAWAARPLELTRHDGRTVLVLKDPGGEPLDRVLEREQGRPLDLIRFLHIAISLATALGHVHRQALTKGHQACKCARQRRRQCMAHRLRDCVPTSARTSGTRAAGDHCRHPGLHGARTDWLHESLD